MDRTLGDHEREAELVAGLAAAVLEPSERRKAERHLARCATCRDLHARYLPAFAAVGASAPAADPPERLRARVLRRGPRPVSVPVRRLPRVGRPRAVVAILLLAAVPLAALGVAQILANRAPLPAAATLTVMADTVELERAGTRTTAADGVELRGGERIRTGAGGVAVVTFPDGSTLTLDPGTEIALEELVADEPGGSIVSIFQAIGRTWSSVRRLADPSSRYEIRTPVSTAVVRGSAFELAVAADGTTTEVTHEGTVTVRAGDTSVLAAAGSGTTVRPNAAPAPPAAYAPRLEVTFAANGPLLVIDPGGLACGVAPNGAIVRQAPRCLATEHQVSFADPPAGAYRVIVAAVGEVAVHASAVAGSRSVFERSAAVAATGGELLLTTLRFSESSDGAFVAERFTPFAVVDRAPARIVERPTPPPTADPRPSASPTSSARPTATVTPSPGTDTSGPLVAVGAPLSVAGPGPQTVELVARLDDRGGSGVREEPRARAFVLHRSFLPARTSWDPVNGIFRATFRIDRLDADVVLFAVAAIDRAGNVGTGSATSTILPGSSTPAPAASTTPSPAGGPDVAAPAVSVEAPASVDDTVPREVSVVTLVRDAGRGVAAAPRAQASVLGAPLALLSTTWDPGAGRFTATFLLDRPGPSIVFRVVAIDAAGNVGSGGARTTIETAGPTPAPTATPRPADAIPATLTAVAPDSVSSSAQAVAVTGYAKDEGGLRELRASARAYDGTGTILSEWAGSVSWEAGTGAYRASFQVAIPAGATKLSFVVVGIDRAGNAGFADAYAPVTP